ncbi:MAG TPA: hypothetical protein VHW60_03255 [Caulobacteraceae bacterium]|nr:hypothetical protein [Caulobacteraceae bacterium]
MPDPTLPTGEGSGFCNAAAAAGLIYSQGPWRGSVTYKQVGSYVDYNTPNPAGPQLTFHLPS